MQYRSELGHALASFAWLSSGFVNHCSLCFTKQIPSKVGPYVSDTKRKAAFYLFFASTGGLRLPRIQTHIAENFFIILIFTVSFLIINEYEFCNVGHLASVKNTVLQY